MLSDHLGAGTGTPPAEGGKYGIPVWPRYRPGIVGFLQRGAALAVQVGWYREPFGPSHKPWDGSFCVLGDKKQEVL